MQSKKFTWTSLTGGITSALPILLSCCKSGACVGVCASPIASLLGISSATLANSPWIAVLEPVLIAISAVSFTISYYSLYVLPKFNSCGPDACNCAPSDKERRRDKLNKRIFWFGLILSIAFLSYFEIQKYNTASDNAGLSVSCAPGSCDDNSAGACSAGSDSDACCPGDSTSCEK